MIVSFSGLYNVMFTVVPTQFCPHSVLCTLLTVSPIHTYTHSQAPGAARYYYAMEDYNPGDSDSGISLCKEQQVEVLGINPYGWWWVRVTNDCNGELEEGWVPAGYLRVIDELKEEGTALCIFCELCIASVYFVWIDLTVVQYSHSHKDTSFAFGGRG